MAVCSACGTNVSDDARFCSGCGQLIAVVEDQAVQVEPQQIVYQAEVQPQAQQAPQNQQGVYSAPQGSVAPQQAPAPQQSYYTQPQQTPASQQSYYAQPQQTPASQQSYYAQPQQTPTPQQSYYAQPGNVPQQQNPNPQQNYYAQQPNNYNYQQQAPNYQTGPADVEENRGICVLSYLGILMLIPLLSKPNSVYVRYHSNQGLVLLIMSILIGILTAIPYLGWFLIGPVGYIFTLVCIIMGIVNTVNGQMKPLPLIGNISLIK